MKLKQRARLMNHEEEVENDELWAISYGDMITLLLSFFVIYFSTDLKKDKANQLDSHFITNFKSLDLDKKIKNPISPINNDNKASAQDKFNEIPKFDLLKNAKIAKIGDRLVVTFDQMNFFQTGFTDLNTKGSNTLQEFASKILPYSGLYKISVKAFTDQRPVN